MVQDFEEHCHNQIFWHAHKNQSAKTHQVGARVSAVVSVHKDSLSQVSMQSQIRMW